MSWPPPGRSRPHRRRGWAARAGARAGVALGLSLAAPLAAAGQTPTMPSTLRYGSGLVDVPVASVLPTGTLTVTASGFFVGVDRSILVDDAGAPLGLLGPAVDEFYSDVSLAVGLLDRFEAGVSVQALGGEEEGGDVWGFFGRMRLWEPVDQGVGLAVGARWLKSPSFGDGVEHRPGRLGFADARLRASYDGREGASTNLSAYAVATAFLRGYDGGPLPPNDLTVTLGVGGGMFGGPGGLGFYGADSANGWFMGSAIHFDVSERSALTLMAEHNGFDVNVGAHYDFDGIRVGAQYLATNHDALPGLPASEYQKPKLGLLASLAVCPGRSGWRCRPRAMERVEPDTVFIPPPPPDTVVIRTGGAPPPQEGEPVVLCLATGRNTDAVLTAQGDTLVGPNRVSLRSLGPGVQIAGRYAQGTFWYESGARIEFEGLTYGRSDDLFPTDCGQLLRVGVHEGVPLFAVVDASRPLSALFVPVRPGLWRRYERGLLPEGS